MNDIEALQHRKALADGDLAAAIKAQAVLVDLNGKIDAGKLEIANLQSQAVRLKNANILLERELRRLDAKRQALDAEQISADAHAVRDVAMLGMVLAADDIAGATRALEQRNWVSSLNGWMKREGDLRCMLLFHALRVELLATAAQVGHDLLEEEKTAGAVAVAFR